MKNNEEERSRDWSHCVEREFINLSKALVSIFGLAEDRAIGSRDAPAMLSDFLEGCMSQKTSNHQVLQGLARLFPAGDAGC